MDKSKDYSKEFISTEFPFKASRTIQQMVQLRQKFPNVSGSQKQNVETFRKGGFRRTMSTFRVPQQIYIDQDDFFFSPDQIGQELKKSSKRSLKEGQSQKFDLNKTMKGKESQQKMYASQQHFKEIAIQLTDPVYKVNIDRIIEMNKQNMQKAELQFTQQQLNNKTQQNQDNSITSQTSKKTLQLSKLQSNEIKPILEQANKSISTKVQLQTKKSIGDESIGNSISYSINNPLPEYYSSIPLQIQSKHKMSNLLYKIEENNKEFNDFQMNKTQMVLPFLDDEIKIDNEYDTTGRKHQGYKSQKWFRMNRKSSTDSSSFLPQRDFKSDFTYQMHQTSINQSQNQGNQMMIDESSIIGKKVETLQDQSIQDRTNPILSFHSESEIRHQGLNISKRNDFQKYDIKEGDTTLNNNPFLQDEDLNIPVNTMGDELLIIKIPNLQNYKVQPLELFDLYLNSDPDPLELIKESSIRAYSKWVKENGEMVWKDCEILKYNPSTKRFLIKWISNQRLKEVTRLNLMYEWENEEIMNRRNKEAIKKREQLLYYMGLKVFVGDEKSQDKSIYFSKQSLVNITDKVFNSKAAKKVVEEILEMFKYEVIKFACEIHTVPTLDHFFEAYFPELKRNAIKQNLAYEVLMNCQNHPERMGDDQKINKKEGNTEGSQFLKKQQTINSKSPEGRNEGEQSNLNTSQNQKRRLFLSNRSSFANINANTSNNQQIEQDSIKQDTTRQDPNETQESKGKSNFFKQLKEKLNENIAKQNQELQNQQQQIASQDQKQNESIQQNTTQQFALQEESKVEGQQNQTQEQLQQAQQNQETTQRKESQVYYKSGRFNFKSANITQYSSIQGISDINFKRTQFLASPNSQEFLSLRQTQQESMQTMISQLKLVDYEFISEEVYNYRQVKRVEDNNDDQNNKLEDEDVFKYTQNIKSALLFGNGFKVDQDTANIYFQHYAIPQPYFQFLKSKLMNCFYFSTEYHNTVFKRIVPNIAKRILEIKSVIVFQFLQDMKSPYLAPAMVTLSQSSIKLIYYFIQPHNDEKYINFFKN